MRLRWLLAGCLAVVGCTGEFPDEEKDASPQGGAGGAGGAGGFGGAGGGAGGMGGAGGGAGGMGGAGGAGGMGGAGGGMVDPNGCEAACARLADCAAGDGWCPDIGPAESANVATGCLAGCTPDLAVFVTGAAACDDFMQLALAFSGELFDACGEPLPDGVEPNCIAIAEASCARYSDCGALADDGMGNQVPFSDVCGAGIRAIAVGLAPCGSAGDNYANQGAVDACIGAIGQVGCAEVCSGQPVSPPAACNGVINVDAASFQCE